MAILERKYFKLLYKEFLSKALKDYRQRNNEEGSLTQIFAQTNFDPNKDTIKDILYSQKNVVNYLKGNYPHDWESRFNAQYL